MPTIVLGFRRLYDALGVTASAIGEIDHRITLADGRTTSVYLGPTPPLGIACIEGDPYFIPGRAPAEVKIHSEYKAPTFLEIAVRTPKQISGQQLDRLKRKDNDARAEIFRMADEHEESAENLLDAVSGLLGLQVHRQLVLKPISIHPFIEGGFETSSSYTGPVTEILEEIRANPNTAPHIHGLLESIANTRAETLQKRGAVLHWLLKAWREPDPVAKFVYMFVPLEAVLQSSNKLTAESNVELDSLEHLVQISDEPNKDVLMAFLGRARTRFGPTLSARFEDFAQRAAIPGWDLDIKAFKKFNRMRNLLLHTGDRGVRDHLNFEEHSRTLEDLVERYVAVALLERADVYQSRWRPRRPTPG